MQALNFPLYQFKYKTSGKITQIFDITRRKYVALTPEEWVRQHFLHYLINDKKFPLTLLAVEMTIKVNQLKKRCDIVGYDKSSNPVLIVECKAPGVKISQETFNQVARYNIPLKVRYLAVSNGLQHYACRVNFTTHDYQFLNGIPDYYEITGENH